MSKPNGISYGIVPEDEGSDMDVSSDDDGVSMYPTFTSTQNEVYQQQHQMPHENIVRDLQNYIHQEKSKVLPIIPRVESFASRATTSANSNSYASRVAQQNIVVIDDDDNNDSDNESSSSFYTAPSSPVDLTLNDQEHADMDHQPDLVDHLQKEYDILTKELVFIDKEEERIIAMLEEKKAQLESIRVKQLELQVRKSIEKNRKAVMTPKPSLANGKGKEKATNDEQINSYSGSDEDDDTPMKKAKAIANPLTGRPQRQAVVNNLVTKPQKQAVVSSFATNLLKQEVEEDEKEDLEDDERRGRMIKGKRIVDSPIPPDNTPISTPHFPQRHKKSNNYLQLVRKSQVSGNTTIGQMKMFLCDLYDKYLEDDDINEQQRAHYKDLAKKISKFNENGDNYIPSKGCSHKNKAGKKSKRTFAPKTHLMLPPEYYGHPERLNFDDMSVERNKLLDAINCVNVATPRRVRRINELLLRSPSQLNVTDFQEIIDANGEVIDSNQVKEYTGTKKLNKLIALYMMVTDPACADNTKSSKKARAKIRARANLNAKAKAKIALKRERLRPEAIEFNQEASRESVAEFASSSRITHESASRPTFISDIGSSSRVSVVTPDVVSLSDHPSHFSPVEPFNQLFNPKPVTTISHSSDAQTKESTSLLPPPTPASTSTPAPALTLAPVSAPTPAPASIPSKQTPLQLYNGSPSPAQVTSSSPSSLSKPTATTTNNQANTQNQYKPAFQPYRSVLNSLGVVSTPDVIEQKTGMLCRAESTGGICNDKRCPHMHFTDFT